MSTVKEALRSEETQTNIGRTVAGIVNSIETLEGGGFLVRRPFPKASFSDFDPFLLLDEMGPMDVAPGEAKDRLPARLCRTRGEHPIIRIEDSRRSHTCFPVTWSIRIPVDVPDGLDQVTCNG